MGVSIRQIRKAAVRHFQARELPASPLEFPAALAACADDLVARFRVSIDDAHDVAMSAFAEVSGRETPFRIDLDLTNPYQVFLIDTRLQTRRVIPLVDLVRMLGPRAVAA